MNISGSKPGKAGRFRVIPRLVAAFRDCARGSVAIELALLAPVLAAILLGSVDLGSYIYEKMQIKAHRAPAPNMPFKAPAIPRTQCLLLSLFGPLQRIWLPGPLSLRRHFAAVQTAVKRRFPAQPVAVGPVPAVNSLLCPCGSPCQTPSRPYFPIPEFPTPLCLRASPACGCRDHAKLKSQQTSSWRCFDALHTGSPGLRSDRVCPGLADLSLPGLRHFRVRPGLLDKEHHGIRRRRSGALYHGQSQRQH